MKPINENKKAIIIGASSGIGKQLAILLTNKNYIVGITGRRKNLLEEIKQQSPQSFIVSDFDITNTDEVEDKLNLLASELGMVDLIILSSGNGEINHELDFAIEKKTLDLNVVGFAAVTDWVIHYFQKQKQGHFVAITSIAGIRGSRQAPAYSASKAFQINYLAGLQQKITKQRLPIYVTDIRPGFVNTNMAKGYGKFWVAPVEKAAKQILKAIEQKKAVVYITKRWRIIAIILKLIPRYFYKRV